MSPGAERLVEVLTAPLDSIVDVSARTCPSEQVLREWRLPERDLDALSRWGLPNDGVETPDFQAETEPVLVPNVAGPFESLLITPEDRLYLLGGWGSREGTPRMGAVAGDGRVLAIRKRPMTVEDIHRDLRPYRPHLHHPSVNFINSSVAQLVQVCWRWRAAVQVMRTLEEPAFDAPHEEVEAFWAGLRECEWIVLQQVERIDDQLRAVFPGSLWYETITDPGH
ncbi:SUKH-4 family immunity protein [Lentzea californiensis]|uniref:SUKH-4 family immunity protein n=1 Tax=Lentzea californiensis TaxID=438851 RepID=UPI00216495F9|nr:SUKH-4 family immunity protein [Lentzea californiensis]MCR3746320.1 SUKH-4 immunity protein [Lentzea californiensis]